MKGKVTYLLFILCSLAYIGEGLSSMMKSVDDCAVSCTKDVENEDNTPDSKENNGKDEESKFSENFFIICDNKTNLFEMQLNARNLNFNNWDSLHQDITSSDYTNEVFAPPDFV